MAERGERVGVIGLGNIGGRVARRLSASGVDVVGYDVDPRARGESGVRSAPGQRELAADVDVILLSLPGPEVIHRVVFDTDGLVDVCRPGQVVVDLSTTDPRGSEGNAAALAARGVAFMDASISGGPAAAEAGTLTIMAGAQHDVFAANTWLLDKIGSAVHHVGDVGAGNRMKLVNNFLNGVSLAATAEALVVAQAAGLDLRQVLEIINQSSGRNYATEVRFPRILEGDYMEGGLSTHLMIKDLVLYLRFANHAGAPSVTAPACLATFRIADALGYGEQVSNHVVDALSELSTGKPMGQEAG